MSYRAPVDLQYPTVTIHPTAEPVDTYVRPAISPAQQLVHALAEVSPKLQQFSDEYAQRADANAQQEGADAFLAAHAKGTAMADATRAGDLPMQDNAWFKAGWREQEGKVSAGEMNDAFIASLAKDPSFQALRDSTDLGAFDSAWAQARADFLKGHPAAGDEFFAKGFEGLSEQYRQQARFGFAQGLEKKIGDASDASLHALSVQLINNAVTHGWNADQVGRDLSDLARLNIARGRPEVHVYDTISKAVANAALLMPEPEDGLRVLDVMSKADGLGGGKLADSAVGAGLYTEARDQLIGKDNAQRRQAYEDQEHQDKATKEEWAGKMAQAVMKSPGSPQRDLINSAPAELQPYLISLASQLKSDRESSARNDYAAGRLLARITDPNDTITPEDISGQIGHGINWQDAAALISHLQTIRSADGKAAMQELKNAPMYTTGREAIEHAFSTPNDLGGTYVKPEDQTKLTAALASYDYQALDAKLSGKLPPDPRDQVAYFQALSASFTSAPGGQRFTFKGAAPSPIPLDPNNPAAGMTNVGAFAPDSRSPQSYLRQPHAPAPSGARAPAPLPAAGPAAAAPADPAKAKAISTASNELTKAEWAATFSDPALYARAAAIASKLGEPMTPDFVSRMIAEARQ